MPRELDKVYAALKAAEALDGSAFATGDAEQYQNAAVEAMCLMVASVVWDRASKTDDPETTYKRLYAEVAPRALILVTTSIDLLQGMAEGRSNDMLDTFLKELSGGN